MNKSASDNTEYERVETKEDGLEMVKIIHHKMNNKSSDETKETENEDGDYEKLFPKWKVWNYVVHTIK